MAYVQQFRSIQGFIAQIIIDSRLPTLHSHKGNKLVSADPEIYEGQRQDNHKQGQGKMMYPSGAIYEGQWDKDRRHGSGVISLSNGDRYEGQWSQDQIHQPGKFTWGNGETYEGQFLDGKRNGAGQMRYISGETYQGQWRDEIRHGQGIMTWTDGGRYEGEWQNDVRHGYGTMRYTNGPLYEGEWQDDMRQGRGTIRWSNGDMYEGQWQNDKIHGVGIKRFGNGNIYQGEFQNNKFNGRGQYKCSDGRVYEGQFRDNDFEGEGTYTWPDGKVYEGQHRGDKPEGSGTMRYSNGDIYKGEWKAGQRHGVGEMKYASEEVYEGEWQNDKKDGRLMTNSGPQWIPDAHTSSDSVTEVWVPNLDEMDVEVADRSSISINKPIGLIDNKEHLIIIKETPIGHQGSVNSHISETAMQQRQRVYDQYIQDHHAQLRFGDWISFADDASPKIYPTYHDAAVEARQRPGWFCWEYRGVNPEPYEIDALGLFRDTAESNGNKTAAAYIKVQIFKPGEEKGLELPIKVDTGADSTYGITQKINELGLVTQRTGRAAGAFGGAVDMKLVEAEIQVGELPRVWLLIMCPIDPGLNTRKWLLGQDFLKRCKHIWTGDQEVQIQFLTEAPNPASVSVKLPVSTAKVDVLQNSKTLNELQSLEQLSNSKTH